jgi:lycopene beta-cyclase
MARIKKDGLIIVGGGLAGSLAALAMAKLRPEVPLLLIEEKDSFGGDHIWSFIDCALEKNERWLIDPLIAHRWPGYYVSFPGHNRKLKLDYSSISGQRLDGAVREALRPDQYRLGTRAAAVRENEVVLPGGEVIRADGAIDARGASALSLLTLGWHKFLGHEYEFARPHRVDQPVLIDATIEQVDGLHFAHILPLSDTRLLIADSYISDKPDLDTAALEQRIEAYVKLRGWKGGNLARRESGILPLARSDDVHAFWRGAAARVAKLGLRGGYFHPSTGHTLADAVRTAILLAQRPDFSGAALHDFFEADVAQLWKKREFYRSFNAMLFDAPNGERRNILERLYRLDAEVIARFHATRLTMVDRMRLSGVKAAKTER